MLKLYTTLDDENVINKTLTHQKNFNIRFKDKFDVITPDIKLRINDGFNIIKCNYAYIEDFNRYYFISKIGMISDDIYIISLECDVLESYKDDILNSLANVTKTIDDGEFYEFSPTTDVRKTIDVYEGEREITLGKNIVLSSIGGGIHGGN